MPVFLLLPLARPSASSPPPSPALSFATPIARRSLLHPFLGPPPLTSPSFSLHSLLLNRVCKKRLHLLLAHTYAHAKPSTRAHTLTPAPTHRLAQALFRCSSPSRVPLYFSLSPSFCCSPFFKQRAEEVWHACDRSSARLPLWLRARRRQHRPDGALRLRRADPSERARVHKEGWRQRPYSQPWSRRAPRHPRVCSPSLCQRSKGNSTGLDRVLHFSRSLSGGRLSRTPY
mmetsp:Transcript_14940/g.31680  ORF Transcript_14940/g.31680 Transcript_14940/m.31680 type:complete len:230 (-) Transcript_14940:431-1120(-)